MLLEIDRLQLATPDPSLAIDRWTNILGAVVAKRSQIRCLSARCTTLRLGSSEVEILEPDGAGLVADAIAQRGPHMFSAGNQCHLTLQFFPVHLIRPLPMDCQCNTILRSV